MASDLLQNDPSEAANAAPSRAWAGARAWLADAFSLDVRSLALFRIALALIVLVDLGIRTGELTAFHTDAGIVPRSRMGEGSRVSLHALGGTVAFESAAFAVQALFAVAMLVGYRTRLATFVTSFLVLSLQLRNPFVLQGGDGLLRILLFWGIFLPLGACWSVDARRNADAVPKRTLSVPAAGLILQLCFLYWFSVLLKSDSAWHEEGTAVYLALSLDSLAKPAGLALAEYPDLCRFLTWGTYWFELLGPVFLFAPVFRWQFRLAAVAAFLGFHLIGLNLCMELGPFPYVCAAGWVALLPSAFWDRLRSWRGGSHRFGAGFITAPAGLNLLALALIVYVFLWNVRTVAPAQAQNVLPQSLNPIGLAFGLDQSWGMFAPRPPLEDGWFVCQGTLKNGEEVDLLRDGRPLTWDKPGRVAAHYPNERWRKFMMNLPGAGQDENRAGLIEYLWDRWNRTHPAGRQLTELNLYYVLEVTLPENQTEPPKPLLLGVRKTETAHTTTPADAGAAP